MIQSSCQSLRRWKELYKILGNVNNDIMSHGTIIAFLNVKLEYDAKQFQPNAECNKYLGYYILFHHIFK